MYGNAAFTYFLHPTSLPQSCNPSPSIDGADLVRVRNASVLALECSSNGIPRPINGSCLSREFFTTCYDQRLMILTRTFLTLVAPPTPYKHIPATAKAGWDFRSHTSTYHTSRNKATPFYKESPEQALPSAHQFEKSLTGAYLSMSKCYCRTYLQRPREVLVPSSDRQRLTNFPPHASTAYRRYTLQSCSRYPLVTYRVQIPTRPRLPSGKGVSTNSPDLTPGLQ